MSDYGTHTEAAMDRKFKVIGAALAMRPFVQSPKEVTKRTLEIVIAHDVDCPGEMLVQSFDANGVLSAPE